MIMFSHIFHFRFPISFQHTSMYKYVHAVTIVTIKKSIKRADF